MNRKSNLKLAENPKPQVNHKMFPLLCLLSSKRLQSECHTQGSTVTEDENARHCTDNGKIYICV